MNRLIVVALFLPLTCLARLGDSSSRLESRYGRCQGRNGSNYFYRAEGYTFKAFMINGTCEVFDVSHNDKSKLSDIEIDTFLKKNGQDFRLIDGPSPDKMYWLDSPSGNEASYSQTNYNLTFVSKKAQSLNPEEANTKAKTDRF